jgi:hypothetical protein
MLRQNVNNDVHHEGTKDTKDLGIYSLTPNFVLFAIFVVKTQGSTLVAAPPRWAFVVKTRVRKSSFDAKRDP